MRGVVIAAMLLLVLGALLLSTPTTASAQGAEALNRPTPGIPSSAPPLGQLYVGIGQSIGGPAGLVSAAGGWVPTRWLTLGLGIGLSVDGVQGAATAAAYLPYAWGKDIGVELGASVGPYTNSTCAPDFYSSSRCPSFEWDVAYWVHGTLVGRWRMGRLWWFRLLAGYTRLVNVGDARCRWDPGGDPCDANPRSHFESDPFVLGNPFIAVGLAYTFDP